MKNTKEQKRFLSYVVIGLFTTALTYLIWTIFIQIGFSTFPIFEKRFIVSVCQFLASLVVIGVSLYLNRKITFKDVSRKHKKKSTTIIHFYLLYGTNTLIASVITLIIQSMFPFLFLEIVKFIGIFVNMVLNYLGQKKIIYNSH
jgi:putative flippase GtrA